MTERASWWRDLGEKLKNDAVSIAEGIALEIAVQVNKVLEAEDLSRKNLAERMQVSQPYVTQILSGQTNMTILTLSKVASALGLQVSLTLKRPELLKSTLVGKTSIESSRVECIADVATSLLSTEEVLNRIAAEQQQKCWNSTTQSCQEEALTA
jgi:transcriptional regulator with XRE-family HTH domain